MKDVGADTVLDMAIKWNHDFLIEEQKQWVDGLTMYKNSATKLIPKNFKSAVAKGATAKDREEFCCAKDQYILELHLCYVFISFNLNSFWVLLCQELLLIPNVLETFNSFSESFENKVLKRKMSNAELGNVYQAAKESTDEAKKALGCGMVMDTLVQLRTETEPTFRKNMLNYTLDLLRSARIDNVPLALMAELRGASVMAP